MNILTSRSTWACELKYIHETAWGGADTSRSTWACELKYTDSTNYYNAGSHAPRERVSWNKKQQVNAGEQEVTLHVSVWVEMKSAAMQDLPLQVTLHVSVWVEMKQGRYL